AMALITVAGALPVLASAIAVDRWLATLLTAALAICLLLIVLLRDRLTGVADPVAQVWSALSAVSTLLAVTTACRGGVPAPVLLALATGVAVAGRSDVVARWAAIGFGVVGGGIFLHYAPPVTLATATPLATATAVSILAASILLAMCATTVA